MRSRRVIFWLGIAVAVALAVWLRLYTKPQLAGAGVPALTSDDYYHLRRARFAVAHYPRTILFDPLMNFPDGGVPIWPPLFDVALATPARLLHGVGAPAEAVERAAAQVPLLFAAGAVLFAGLLGRRLSGEAGGAAAALFVAACPAHILWTQYGHADQHVAESFFGLAVLVLFLTGRDEPDGSAKRRGEIGTGLALGLAVLTWQGAIYWGAVVALALFLETALTRRPVAREAAVTLGLAAAVAAVGTALWLGPRRAPFTYVSFGWFQPLFLAALAGGTVLCDTALAAARRQLTRRDVVVRCLLLGFFGAAVLPFAGGLVAGFARGVGYAAGVTPREAMANGGYLAYPKDWLRGIGEARPLLADAAGRALAWGGLSAAFCLAPAVVCLWALRAARRERAATHAVLAVWGIITLFLTLSQRLNVYYAAPFAAVCLLEAARFAGERFSISRPAWRALAAAAAGLLLVLPMALRLREDRAAAPPSESEVFAMLGWMRQTLPRTVDPYDSRLLGPPPFPPDFAQAASILAPWSLGHRILYVAGQPVVANNFGYGFRDGLRFFLAQTEEEALAIARRRRARWVVSADLLPRMNDYASALDRPPLLEVNERGLAPTAAYFRTLQSRLFDFEGRGVELPGEVSVLPLAHFRLVYRSKSGVRRGERFVAQWKVFEITD